jgi:hypothetical protein
MNAKSKERGPPKTTDPHLLKLPKEKYSASPQKTGKTRNTPKKKTTPN